MNRDERIENYYHWSAWDLAERIVDLEDTFVTMTQIDDNRLKLIKRLEVDLKKLDRLWRDREKENGELFDRLMSAENKLDKAQELDPERLESALRMYVAELDYDKHKYIMCSEDDGLDHYPEEVEYFLRCWETAGEG